MSIYKELSYFDNEISTIKGIRFCVLSPDEIKRTSVAEITKTDTFVGNEPVPNGLFDARMGILDNNKVCQTCQQKNTFCPGHFGHIILAKPVFYIQFFDIVKKLLKCVCFRCSKLLVDPDSEVVKAIQNKKLSRQKKWELMYKLCSKVKRCGQENTEGCGAKQPDKVYRDPIVKVVMEWKDIDVENNEIKKMILHAEDVHKILSRISDKDCNMLGFSPKFNRPEWMICTVLPVPPPAVRPSVRSDTGQRSEDDLTHKLCDIVKNNNTLRQKIDKGVSKEQIDIAAQVLQYHIATFIDNSIPGINPAQQRTGRLLKSLSERLKSKEGRIRGNLMGKRVDFSARSVITPDPNISIDELGVPIKIAMNLTFPEIVNQYNIIKLTELVRNGPDVYPGAKFIKKPKNGNQTKWLKKIDRSSIVLEEGDIVERHLMDGDYVLFNRQPSLHKMSMLGHRIKVMPYNTFRLNPLVCVSFNADFDGDEMNLHVPQSIVTENELRSIAAVPYQIMSPKECKPLIAVVQDVALGIYRLTKNHIFLSDKNFFNLLSTNSKFYGNVPRPASKNGDILRWSGKQALSAIIPNKVNVKSANNSYDEKVNDKENFVIIENGEILQGTIDKKIYQNRTKGLIHSIFNDCNEEETRHFFDNTQRLICNWLVQSGFSVGISDLIVDDDTQLNLKKVINDMKVQVYDIIKNIHMNKFENLTINNNHDFFESEINKILNKAREQTGKLGLSKINDKENRMINMIKSGSKGSVINVAQMIACVGQQNVDGKRIAYGFDNRTLPHYVKYDDGPDSRGFVENSFISGLSPQEFFFHSMGGREGLIDTAVKTSETGYLQRKLVKAMEDCKINYDYTVRNASGSIIQFLYGEDGMDPIKIESQSLPYIDMDYQKLQADFLLSKDDDLQYLLDDRVLRELKGDWDAPFRKHFDQIIKDREFMITNVFKKKQDNSFMYPVSFSRIINNAKAMMSRYGIGMLSDLSPFYILESIEKLCEELFINPNNRGDGFIKVMVRCHLSPKQVICSYKFNKDVFDYVVQQVKHRFFDAIAHPSEMVGVVAAQSIGEPCTQMSQSKDTYIRVIGDNNFSYSGTIQNFIDKLLEQKKEDVIVIGEDSVVLDLEQNYQIIGVSNEEKTSWKQISQVSRHPANGGLVKVTTRSGKTTTSTLTHSFLGRTESGIREVKGSDLKIGDRIPVAKHIPEASNALTSVQIGALGEFVLDKELGWLCGVYLADGNINGTSVCISKAIPEYIDRLAHIALSKFNIEIVQHKTEGAGFKNYQDKKYVSIKNILKCCELAKFLSEFGNGSANKIVPAWVFGSNLNFIAGIIQGYFDGDGSVNGCQKTMIRAGSTSEKLINDMIVLLAYHDIFGSKCYETCTTGKIRKVFYTVQISRKYGKAFRDNIGFTVKLKSSELDKLITYTLRDKTTDIEQIDKIPCVGHIIANVGKALNLKGQSRTYGRWVKKESIGRNTLIKYINIFEKENAIQKNKNVANQIGLLSQAAYSGVVWDEIVDLEYLDDPKEFVYDFTVPGNDSFMVDTCIIVHNTLNTFHHSGISSASKAVRGVPRIKELLSVTKNIKAPSMTVHLKNEFNKDKMKANEVLKSVQTTFFKDIVKSSKIYYDINDFATDIDDDAMFVNSYKELMDLDLVKSYDTAPWLLRFEINRDKLLEEGISMITLYNILQDYYEETISCMFSDDNSNNLVFRIKLLEEGNDEERDYITELKALEKNIMENILIKGTKNINKAMMNKQEYSMYDEDTLQFDKTFEWVLDTSGTNLIDIMCHSKVDYTRTVSNDINEIYDVLGIEAARAALYNELSGVIADAELYVNYRHIALLVDTMTNRGYLLSIDRHGINRVDIGPLAKCSFEETTDMLIKAGIFSEVDKITGVSANIMLGQIPPCGTGDTEILIDEHKLLNQHANIAKFKEEDGEQNDAEYADVCTFDNLAFNFRLPAKKEAVEPIDDFEITIV